MGYVLKVILYSIFFLLITIMGNNLLNYNLWATDEIKSPFNLAPYGEDYSTKDEEGIIDNNQLSISGIIIGKSSFNDAFKRFGRARKFNLYPNDSHSPIAICYLSTDKKDKTFVWFESGYLGDWNEIYAFIIGNKDFILQFKDKCSRSNLVNNKLVSNGGVYYGMKKSDFEKRFTKPLKIKDNYYLYRYLTKVKAPKEILDKNIKMGLDEGWNYFYVNSGIYVSFTNEKIDWFKVYKSESN